MQNSFTTSRKRAWGVLGEGPDTRGTKVFTADTLKMILGQSIYQVVITLVFHFLGHNILGLDHSDHGNLVAATLAFDAFVFVQIFVREKCATFLKNNP